MIPLCASGPGPVVSSVMKVVRRDRWSLRALPAREMPRDYRGLYTRVMEEVHGDLDPQTRTNSKHWLATSLLLRRRCREAMLNYVIRHEPGDASLCSPTGVKRFPINVIRHEPGDTSLCSSYRCKTFPEQRHQTRTRRRVFVFPLQV